MNRERTWKTIRRWVAATTAVAALAAPLSADLAEAAAPSKKTKADTFEKKTDSFTKKADLFKKTEPKTDRFAKKDPRHTRLVEAIIVRLKSAGDSVARVNELDETAVGAGANLRLILDKMEKTASKMDGKSEKKLANTLKRKYKRSLGKAATRYENAEAALMKAEDSMWSGFDGNMKKVAIVDQPLAAALLQLQIELRRMLGVRFHTEVTNLREMPGCGGDLILDRLIARYGAAVLSIDEDRSAEVEVLRQISTQLACISAEQSRRFDYALYTAYFRAFDKLQKAGLKKLQGPFARLVAPLMLLVHDTVKHRGHGAASWYWWNEHRVILEDQVARLGWATGNVYWMYDRIDGALIGFPECAGSNAELCVNPDVLLASLRDPAALGLGDCALSGMVAGGITSMGGHGDRYACSQDCSDVSSSTGNTRFGSRFKGGSFKRGTFDSFAGSRLGGNGGSSAGSNMPWHGLTSGDFAAMQSECGGAGGAGGGGEGGAQGPGGSLGGWGGMQECMDEFLNQPASPFHAHAQCIIEASGGNNPLDLTSFQGVPMDPKCSLMDGGGTDTDTDDDTDTDTDDDTDTDTDTDTDSGTDTTTEEPSTGQKIWNAIKTFFGIPTAPSGAGAVVGVQLELLDPENGKKIYDTAGAVIMNRLELAHAAGEISEAEYGVLKDMKPAEVKEYMNNKGIRDCANPEDCSDSCTAMNSQMAARRECDEQFLEDTIPPEYQNNNPNDPDNVINWGPDGNPNEQGQIDGVLGCMLDQAGNGGNGANPQCGLVTCAEGSSTAWSATNCCQDLGSFTGEIPVHDSCFQMQCADGNPSTGQNGMCTCADSSGAPVGNPEPPTGPEHGIGLGGLLSDHLR